MDTKLSASSEYECDLIDSLAKIVKLKIEIREKNINLFKETILNTYDKQVEDVTNLFRELHDSLHYKEVQVKREMKSYFESNNEIYTKEISMVDYEIEKLNKLIDSIRNLSDNNISIKDIIKQNPAVADKETNYKWQWESTNNNWEDYDKDITEKIEKSYIEQQEKCKIQGNIKIKFNDMVQINKKEKSTKKVKRIEIKHPSSLVVELKNLKITDKYSNSENKLLDQFCIDYNEANSEILNKKINYEDINYVNVVTIGENQAVKSAIDEISCDHGSIQLSTYEVEHKSYSRLYRYEREKGLLEMNMETGKVLNIHPHYHDDSPNLFSSRIYQNNNANSKIHIFGSEGKLYIMNLLEKPLRWRVVNMPFTDTTNLSTIYDGVDSIYIFGGYNKQYKVDQDHIYQYNINSEEFIKVGEMDGSLGYNATLVGGSIYLVGGYKNNTYHSSILSFDIKTHTMTILETKFTIPKKISLIESGCYISKTNHFYIYTQTAEFYKYSHQFNSLHLLASPNDAKKGYYVKMIYDNDNRIFFFSKGETKIYIFNLQSETWSSIEFQNLLISETDYFAFS